ncbi:MAG: hypothetical protein E6I76_05340 [Chloroflexi bacterium]|nr:MAG: hypothetical protein E6I76_05340 [Chloroflexota bacterium]
MLRGRRSATALADDARERGSDIAESLGSTAGEMGSKAAETVSDLAEKAAELAREAQRAATPVIRSAMATAAERARDAQQAASPVVRSAAATAAGALSDAAEHAAEVLADTAERLTQTGAEQADELQLSARTRLADASERMAKRIRPRRRRRGLRALLIGTGVVGAGAGVWLSPLGSRIRILLGMSPAEEPAPPAPSIVLPAEPSAGAESAVETTAAEPPAADNGDRVLTGGRNRGSGKKS